MSCHQHVGARIPFYAIYPRVVNVWQHRDKRNKEEEKMKYRAQSKQIVIYPLICSRGWQHCGLVCYRKALIFAKIDISVSSLGFFFFNIGGYNFFFNYLKKIMRWYFWISVVKFSSHFFIVNFFYINKFKYFQIKIII